MNTIIGPPSYADVPLCWIRLDEMSETVELASQQPPPWDAGWGQATIATAYRYANSMAGEGWSVTHR